MPQMHVEHLGTAEFAHKHHDVIARFGPFPHRNAALGRVSTPARTRLPLARR
jgi:uncharacterized protein (DUF924 family)